MSARGTNGRWLRKYKVFFIIGVVILSLQVFLASRFLDLSKPTSQDGWHPQTQPQPQHIKLKKPNSTSILRLEELEFKPNCEITSKEAVSAIHRARTQKCKKIIADVACQALNGTLYPKRLPGSCPNGGHVAGRALGCFKDETSYRLLNGYFGVNKRSNSPEYCINLCLQSGFPFAGVQYSNECFCGNDEPITTLKLPDSSCNMKCPGDKHATCGGYYTMNVFQTGIEKFAPQIANIELMNPTERPVRIVFLLTLNGRALRQVKRLFKMLYHKDHYYYIHVDVREDYLFRELLPLEKRFSNVRLSRSRFATIWGGASLLEMLLSCMNELLQMTHWKWDYVLNLSESDYPVKLVSSLERFLTANKDRNFVKSHGRDTQRFLQKQGLDKTFVECDTRMWRVADRHLPHGLQMDGGSDWIALSRPFVAYVTSEPTDELIKGLRKVFKHTLLPAESFFHTVLRNSRFCNSYIDNNLHVTNWKRKLGCKCQYKHVVDWCGCSPNDFRPDDWTRIQTTSTRQLYFARKFEPIINQAIILKLELWLYGLERPSKEVRNLYGYWQSLFHHMDLSPSIDDGLMTISFAATRHWLKTLNCSLDSQKPLEAISYHYNDQYKYTLVQFVVKQSLAQLQIAFRPKNMINLITPTVMTGRLVELIVSSDYDQKEQLSRNFAQILSPYSEPMLIYKFLSSDSQIATNISCMWLNPVGQLKEMSEISLDENSAIGFVKSTFKPPHLPGAWTVKLVQKGTFLAEVKFLITPLQYLAGKEISNKQAALIHAGSLSKDLNLNEFNKELLIRMSMINSRRFGKELNDWIDLLFSKFYTVEKVCAIHKQIHDFCGVRIGNCNETDWSSYSPDPKSVIDKINQNGTFDIW